MPNVPNNYINSHRQDLQNQLICSKPRDPLASSKLVDLREPNFVANVVDNVAVSSGSYAYPDKSNFQNEQQKITDNDYQVITKKKSHPYYIKKFLNSFTDDDLMSLASNYDPDLYHHVVSCKYCKMKINYEMKKRFLNELSRNKFNVVGYNNDYQNDYHTIDYQNINNHQNINGYERYINNYPAQYVNTSQIQHFDPNLQTNFAQNQALGHNFGNGHNLCGQNPNNNQNLGNQNQTVEKIIEKNQDIKYEQYLMIVVVVILILFLFADIIIKFIK